MLPRLVTDRRIRTWSKLMGLLVSYLRSSWRNIQRRVLAEKMLHLQVTKKLVVNLDNNRVAHLQILNQNLEIKFQVAFIRIIFHRMELIKLKHLRIWKVIVCIRFKFSRKEHKYHSMLGCLPGQDVDSKTKGRKTELQARCIIEEWVRKVDC